MPTELELQQSLNEPVTRDFLRSLGITYQNSNSLDYKGLVALVNAQVNEELKIQQHVILQLISAAKEKVQDILEHTPRVNHNIHHARQEEIHRQTQEYIQRLIKQLEQNHEASQKLQKELDKLLHEKTNELQKHKEKFSEEKNKIQEDKTNFIKQLNPDLDQAGVQKRIEEINKMPALSKATQGIQILNIFRELGITGQDLLKLNKFLEKDAKLDEKLAKFEESLEQKYGIKVLAIVKSLATLREQSKDYTLQLQQLGARVQDFLKEKEVVAEEKSKDASLSNNDSTPRSAGFYISPFTWIKDHLFPKQKTQEKEEEDENKSNTSPTFKPGLGSAQGS